MIKVLLLKSDYERIGGPETLLRSLALNFDHARISPVLVMMRRPGSEPLGIYPDRIRQRELPWHGLPALLPTARALAAIVRELDVDVINTHDMRANAVVAAMRPFLRLPWIANVHGWLGATHRGRWKLYEAIDQRLVRLADRVIVGSTAARDEVVAVGARNVATVANGVAVPDTSVLERGREALRAQISVAQGVPVLGMLGRLHAGKGHDVFLRALAALGRKGVTVHALIIGEGPEGTALRALAASLGLTDRVTFTGFVDDAPAWIPAMDVVAIPSIKDSLPLTALEAMVHGRPVVVSRAGDLPLAVEDGVSGFVVPIGDDAALAARLADLARDSALRRTMGAAARQRVIERFSDQAMTRSFEDQYAQIVAAAGRCAGPRADGRSGDHRAV